MTRLRIRDLIRKRLGETTSAFWTDTELNNWINDSGHDIADKVKCIKKNGVITTVESTSEYVLTDAFPRILSVYDVDFYQNGTTWVKLPLVTRLTLDATNTGWRSAPDSTPDQYYTDREENLIGLYPSPNSNNEGAYLRVYYSQDYTDMTSDDDTPTNIPFSLQEAMVDYVVSTGYETRGWGDKTNDAKEKYIRRLKSYMIQRDFEKQEDDQDVMKNYRNIR